MTEYKSIVRKHRMTMIKLIMSLFIWFSGAALVLWYSSWQVLIGVMLMMWANNISINYRMDKLK